MAIGTPGAKARGMTTYLLRLVLLLGLALPFSAALGFTGLSVGPDPLAVLMGFSVAVIVLTLLQDYRPAPPPLRVGRLAARSADLIGDDRPLAA